MTFGVFILHNDSWKMHCTFANKSAALTERTYLVNMLGLVAEVFKK